MILKRLGGILIAAIAMLAAPAAMAQSVPLYTIPAGQKVVSQGSALINRDGSPFSPADDTQFTKSPAPAASATTTIASGASLSGAVDLSAERLTRIVIPAAWTAANLTFQTSGDCSTYSDLYDQYGNEYTVVAAASHAIFLADAWLWAGVRCFKVRSGTGGTPVTQGADRIVTLVTVPR